MDDKRKINSIRKIIVIFIFLGVTFYLILFLYKSFNEMEYNVSKENVFFVFTESDEKLTDLDEYDDNETKGILNYDGNEINKNKEVSGDDSEKKWENKNSDILDAPESKEEPTGELQDEEGTPNEENQTTSPDDSQPITEPIQDPISVPVINSTNVVEGQNPTEGLALMTYINQYRTELGISPLVWNDNLEYEAQYDAMHKATGEGIPRFGYFHTIARRCNGAKTAQEAVSDWMTGNDYIPSEADFLLNEGYTEVGGALYYLPNGDENGYHYFWILCLM